LDVGANSAAVEDNHAMPDRNLHDALPGLDFLAAAPTAGAVAGALAALPMLLALDQLNRHLPGPPERQVEPFRLTNRLAAMAGVEDDFPEPALDAAAVAGHIAYGAAMGSLYGMIEPHIPGPAVGKGIGFGLSVWAGSYAGWLPAVGLFPAPQDRPARRNAAIIGAHVVWGAVLGALTGVLSGSDAD
jgi:putative membrane protein